ncbi:MAG TPA: hypothetical protein VKI44_15460 [Acetobacteraceae bacterium]|nr:hypothetical protein [Acetobacteraceae bacterium]
MTGLTYLMRVGLLAAVALGAAPAFAVAQDRVPTREGNIWDWNDHEPVPSVVSRDEQATGIAQPPAQQEKATGEIESLYRQLMANEANR